MSRLPTIIHLREIDLRDNGSSGKLPFNLPIISGWGILFLSGQVTFFVGENESGKSTLLEAIACAVGSIMLVVKASAPIPP